MPLSKVVSNSLSLTTLAASGAATLSSTLGVTGAATLNTLASSGATLTGGTINGMTIGAVTASSVAATTITASSTLSVTGAGSIEGLTVGRGAGAVATNTVVGASALVSNTTGYFNVAVGSNAFSNVTTGAGNTAVGEGAGGTLATTNNNVYVGQRAIASGSAVSYEIVIGCNITGKGTNTGFVNPGSGGVYQGNNSANWSTTSDQRLKKNIVDNNVGLDKINSIRVRNFEYRVAEEITELPTHAAIKKEGVQLGVIAQELQAVLPECVKTESTGVMSVDSDNLTWYMINAIKELKAQNDSLQARLDAANL